MDNNFNEGNQNNQAKPEPKPYDPNVPYNPNSSSSPNTSNNAQGWNNAPQAKNEPKPFGSNTPHNPNTSNASNTSNNAQGWHNTPQAKNEMPKPQGNTFNNQAMPIPGPLPTKKNKNLIFIIIGAIVGGGILFTVVFVVIILLLPDTSGELDSEYTSDMYGISFEYPSSWEVDESDTNGVTISNAELGGVITLADISFAIDGLVNEGNDAVAAVETVINESISNLAQDNPVSDYQPSVKKDGDTVSGYAFFDVTDGDGTVAAMININQHGVRYILDIFASSNADTYDKTYDVYTSVMATVRITDIEGEAGDDTPQEDPSDEITPEVTDFPDPENSDNMIYDSDPEGLRFSYKNTYKLSQGDLSLVNAGVARKALMLDDQESMMVFFNLSDQLNEFIDGEYLIDRETAILKFASEYGLPEMDFSMEDVHAGEVIDGNEDITSDSMSYTGLISDMYFECMIIAYPDGKIGGIFMITPDTNDMLSEMTDVAQTFLVK